MIIIHTFVLSRKDTRFYRLNGSNLWIHDVFTVFSTPSPVIGSVVETARMSIHHAVTMIRDFFCLVPVQFVYYRSKYDHLV